MRQSPSAARALIVVQRIAALVVGAASGLTAAADVQPWKPAGISSPQFESHPAFDPRTGDLYFVRSTPKFTGWRLFVSRCQDTGWSPPTPPAFAGEGVEADPYFTDDGRSLYFISTRPRLVSNVRVSTSGVWTAATRVSGIRRRVCRSL